MDLLLIYKISKGAKGVKNKYGKVNAMTICSIKGFLV